MPLGIPLLPVANRPYGNLDHPLGRSTGLQCRSLFRGCGSQKVIGKIGDISKMPLKCPVRGARRQWVQDEASATNDCVREIIVPQFIPANRSPNSRMQPRQYTEHIILYQHLISRHLLGLGEHLLTSAPAIRCGEDDAKIVIKRSS